MGRGGEDGRLSRNGTCARVKNPKLCHNRHRIICGTQALPGD
jgi:hypothetical protein